jgi:hypothetical protein
MTNEIERSKGQIERTFDGKRVRTSKAQLFKALAPIFASFPGLEMPDATFNAYHMMLADLDPDKLAMAVIEACKAHKYPTQLITVAAIREAYDGARRVPGPRHDVDPATLPPVPTKMFRLDDAEDYQQRMERLRQTRKWKYDA